MIDFAAANGFDAVLIEGWNVGWDGNWIGDHGRNFVSDRPYPDFDIERIAAYARAKGVELMGHHETAGNAGLYEAQMAPAFALYERLGVHGVKTGYVGDAGGVLHQDEAGRAVWEWHDGALLQTAALVVSCPAPCGVRRCRYQIVSRRDALLP